MKISEFLWGALGVLGVAIGVFEIAQSKILLAASALFIGALLIASSAVKLVKKS